MGTVKKFEDLEVWQNAFTLYKDLLPLFDQLQERRHFELKNQLQRSAGSVMDNIAESFERDGTREFIQFLSVAKGSIGEVRSQLNRVQIHLELETEIVSQLENYCKNLSGKISNFIKYLKDSEIRGRKFT